MVLQTYRGFKKGFFFNIMKKFGIYKITCKVNNKIYIGSTEVCFKQRFKKHKQRLRNNYHENDYLQKSWNKYGEDNFVFEILEEISDKSKVKEIEESYTSKCSFLDNEEICKHTSYKGKRVKRGLFKSNDGTLINADVNGSLNILKKVVGDFDYDPIEVCSTPSVYTVKFN